MKAAPCGSTWACRGRKIATRHPRSHPRSRSARNQRYPIAATDRTEALIDGRDRFSRNRRTVEASEAKARSVVARPARPRVPGSVSDLAVGADAVAEFH